MKMPTDHEWYAKKAAEEADADPTTGKPKLAILNISQEEMAKLEKLANPSRDRIRAEAFEEAAALVESQWNDCWPSDIAAAIRALADPSPAPNLVARVSELEAELVDARLEIEGLRSRKKCVIAPTRETCERVAAKLAKTDPEAAGLVEALPFYIDNAATWRGIAAAMGYEPLGHREARPIGKWLNERVATFRQKVVAAALAAEGPQQ